MLPFAAAVGYFCVAFNVLFWLLLLLVFKAAEIAIVNSSGSDERVGSEASPAVDASSTCRLCSPPLPVVVTRETG